MRRLVIILVCIYLVADRVVLAQDAPCVDADGWPCEVDTEAQFEAIVVAQHEALSAGATEITHERIERAAPSSGSEALGLVPGLRIVQHGSEGKAHQIFLRGFDAVHGSDVEVRLEGIPLNERGNVHGHGYVDLYGIIPEVISQLRVYKGPFMPWQGDFATAGSVHFKLEVPEELRPGLVRTEVGHRGRLRAVTVASPTWRNAKGFVAGEGVYDAGFGPDRQAGRGAVLAKVAHPLKHGWSVDGLVSGQAARWQSVGARRFDDADNEFYASYGPAGLGASDRVLGKLGVSRTHGASDFEVGLYGGWRALELQDNYTGQLLYSPARDRKRQEQSTILMGAVCTLEHRLDLPVSSSLLAGLEWRADIGHQAEHQISRRGQAWRDNRNLDTEVHDLSAYLGWSWQPWRSLRVLPSVRVDSLFYAVEDNLDQRHATAALAAVSPRFALSYAATSWLRLLADYGRGLRSPEPRSIAAPPPASLEDEELSQYTGGRPSIAKADAVEAGLVLTPVEGLELRASGFATWIDREIVFDHVSNTNLELDGTRRIGAEASLRLGVWRFLSLDADATFVDARFNRSRHPVPGTAPWSGSINLGLGETRGPHGNASLSWSGPRDLAHGATTTGYALLDVGAGWRWPHFDISVLVDNALNARIMDGAYHYASWFDTDEPRSSLPVIHYTAARPLTARIVFTAFL